MKLAHNNILIVILMLVAFIGQAMASTVVSYSTASCVHASMNAEMSMLANETIASDMADEGMSQSNMMLAENNQDTIMDCCQELCKCPMNGCVNVSLLVNTHFIYEVFTEQKIAQTFLFHQSQVNSFLYRPPIS